MDSKKIGEFISIKRREKGLTQQQVAQKLNVTFQAVSKWENGSTFPNKDLLLELSDLLGVSADEILRGREKEKVGLTYSRAGVNLYFTEKLKKELGVNLTTNNPRVLSSLGDFASVFDMKFESLKHPVLVMKSEDPGSKQKIAFDFGYIDSICHDMINHLVNDILVMGAKPLAVLDTIMCGNAEKETITSIVKGISDACRENDCALIGGKTTIQKGLIDRGTYLLSSNIVGIAQKDKVIDGSNIKSGDAIIALASNGLHTNGYSLVRLLMDEMPHIKREKINGIDFIDEIMKVHTSYYKPLSSYNHFDKITGMAHITGGGIEGNVVRIIKNNLSAQIDLSRIKVPPIFSFIKSNGNISQAEMMTTFNCGVGMIVIIDNNYSESFIHHCKKFVDCYRVGEVLEGEEKVRFINYINW